MESNYFSKFILKFKFYLHNYMKYFTINNLKYRSSKNPKFRNSSSHNHKILFFGPLIIPFKILRLEEEEKENFDLEKKDIIRGEYENKIRIFSSIEKRFLIFAKINEIKKDYRMNYFQFLDSLVPFQYIKTKKYEDVEKILKEMPHFNKIMKKIDINGDNFISFEEYIILSVIMSIPTQDYHIQYPSGKISRENLAWFLMNKISEIESLKITNKSLVDGRIVKTDYNTLYKNLVDFISLAFPDNVEVDIKKELSSFKFGVFIVLLFYEFFRIPSTGENMISRENFAKVLASYTNIFRNKQLIKKIDQKVIDTSGDISFDEYLTFFSFLNVLSNQSFEIFNKQLDLKTLRQIFDGSIKTLDTNSYPIKKEISDKNLKLLIDLYDENGM